MLTDPDGDITVPIISLGLMPQAGWRSKRLNPAGIRVVGRVSLTTNQLCDAFQQPQRAINLHALLLQMTCVLDVRIAMATSKSKHL